MCLKFLLGSREDPPNRPEVEVSDRQGDQDSCYRGNRLTSSLFLCCLKLLLGSGEDPPNRPEVEVSDRQGDQDSCYRGNRLTFFIFL